MSRVERSYLRPVVKTTPAFYGFLVMLLVGCGLLFYAWWIQLTEGLEVTGISHWVPWGVYISTFVFFVGMAATSLATSAWIRLRSKDEYLPLARIGEFLSLASLLVAAVAITMDLGRPERMISLFTSGRLGSPMVWELIGMTVFGAGALLYIYFTLRYDYRYLSESVKEAPLRLKGLILLGGGKGDRGRVPGWLSVIAILLMVFFIGVDAWLFGSVIAQPSWQSLLIGPVFIAAALASGVAAIAVASGLAGATFGLHNYLTRSLFRGLSRALALLMAIYLAVVAVDKAMVLALGSAEEIAVAEAVLTGEFAWSFWLAVVVGFLVPIAVLLSPAGSSKKGVVPAALRALFGIWIYRYLELVPSMTRPFIQLPWGSTGPLPTYTPTLIEWGLVAGFFVLGTLAFTVLMKLFPMTPVRERQSAHV